MSNIHMQLGNPFFIGIYSLALLLIGAAIGARWGNNTHRAVWLAVLGAALMVVHDMLTCSIIFLVSIAREPETRGGSAKLTSGDG